MVMEVIFSFFFFCRKHCLPNILCIIFLEKSSSKCSGMYEWDEVDPMKYFSLDLEAIAPKPFQIFEDEDKLAWICNICAQPWPESQRVTSRTGTSHNLLNKT